MPGRAGPVARPCHSGKQCRRRTGRPDRSPGSFLRGPPKGPRHAVIWHAIAEGLASEIWGNDIPSLWLDSSRKFWMMTSDCLTIRRSDSRPSSVFRSTMMARLPWLTSMPNHMVWRGPAIGAGGSMRMTSAPNSANTRAAAGPAIVLEISTTRIPSSTVLRSASNALGSIRLPDQRAASGSSIWRYGRNSGETRFTIAPSKVRKRPA